MNGFFLTTTEFAKIGEFFTRDSLLRASAISESCFKGKPEDPSILSQQQLAQGPDVFQSF
jgi:hypothetical protein